ncbi:MAG: L,D-transpeptidase family protein [Gammaproteobacteria bacterium]
MAKKFIPITKARTLSYNAIPYKKWLLLGVLSAGCLFNSMTAKAIELPLPQDGSNVVGNVETARVKGGDNLATIGRRYDVGYYEMLEANPNVNPMQLMTHQKVVIPTRFILPDAPRQGIVINLAELRLYYYPPGGRTVVTEPIGIGRKGWVTPTGTTTITRKRANPTWRAPKSVQIDMAKRGQPIPAVYPPGPNNPLGQYAMNLGIPGYLIHGTNQPSGVGRRVSAGCIRMYPEDIERLFYRVQVGTSVVIVNQQYKAGYRGGRLYLESHKALAEQRHQRGSHAMDAMHQVVQKAAQQYHLPVDWRLASSIAKQQNGLPQVVSSQS